MSLFLERIPPSMEAGQLRFLLEFSLSVGPTFRLPSCRALLLQAKLLRVPLISPLCVLSPGD